jgi:hypothetical protein
MIRLHGQRSHRGMRSATGLWWKYRRQEVYGGLMRQCRELPRPSAARTAARRPARPRWKALPSSLPRYSQLPTRIGSAHYRLVYRVANSWAVCGEGLEDLVGGLGPDEWLGVVVPFAISREPCAATPSAPSQRSALSRHATFPFSFHIQVGRVAQRSPPSEPLPPAGAIQRRVKRRTVALHTAPTVEPVGIAPCRQ